MKLLIEIPTWLGDAIMATPAIENIIKKHKDSEITIVGSYVATQLFINDKRISKIVIDNTKKDMFRYISLYKLAKSLGKFDLSISFRSSFSSKFLLFFTNSLEKYNYKKIREIKHQVLKYNEFINTISNSNFIAGDLILNFSPIYNIKPTLGINPGSTYGSAKRWYPKEFAKVAIELSNKYNIVIFGGPDETNIANDIEKELILKGIKNYQNLSGKTSIKELIENIAGLDILITNDSGPMHIAAAYKIRTYSIFGPTSFIETNQWNNPLENIITMNLDCAPCMKRNCPLKHHNCMKLITANDVLKSINNLT